MVSVPTQTGEIRIVRCSIGNETYAVDMDRVTTIQRGDRLAPPPESDPTCVGTLPGSKGPIPVYELARRLGRSQRVSERTPYVVLFGTAEKPWGILVDRVSRGERVPMEGIHALPPLLQTLPDHPYQGVIHVGEQQLLWLDPDQLHKRSSPLNLHERYTNSAGSALFTPPADWKSPEKGSLRHCQQIVVFRTHDPKPQSWPLSFALSINQVQEIVELPTPIPIPQAPSFVVGLVKWRDLPVPVFDLASRLGLPTTETARSRLLIVPVDGDNWAGLIVRPTIRVLRLPLPHVASERELTINPSLIRGVVELQTETLAIPDLQSTLDLWC